MRDDLMFVDQVQRELRDVRWPGPEEIRARARRRTRRRIAAATAVLALAGTSAMAVAGAGVVGPPAEPALPAASATPDNQIRHEISADALLLPADLQQKVDVQLSQSGMAEPVRIDDLLGLCRTSQGLPEGWQTSRWSRSQSLLWKQAYGDRQVGGTVLTQDLYRLTPEAATQVLSGLDETIAPCAEWRNVAPGGSGGRVGATEVVHRWSVTRRGFAGDDSAMLRLSLSAARDVRTGRTLGGDSAPSSVAVVRVGDLVTVLRPGQDGTEPELAKLAVVAADRMCAAANPAC
ncbi:hypothetical protein [Micromonospora sp. URMC 103]|uniref:hypothetical protein n=1 Tax=Micromonospora sp. URMC 103 TaxID=3423406 RepID=UPI003F1E0A50